MYTRTNFVIGPVALIIANFHYPFRDTLYTQINKTTALQDIVFLHNRTM